LRLEILKSRVAAARSHHAGFDVPAPVLAFIARTITHNGRDLDGALNRLLASNKLTGMPVTMDMAERAVRDLEAAGFKEDQVGYVIRGSDVAEGGMITDTSGAKDGRGAVAGALIGGLGGGALAATVTALLIPGVGPVLAAGALAMFLGYAGAGAAVGGILGAMVGLGVSEDEAKHYDRLFKEGKAIVAVKSATPAAADILTQHGGYHLHQALHSPVETKGVFSEP